MTIKLTGDKSETVKELIYTLLDILEEIGIPMGRLSDRRKERMACACLAVGNIVSSFQEVKSSDDGVFMKTRDIIAFENTHYAENISSGSYDDIRRKDLILLVEAGIIINSSSIETVATNNPTRGYAMLPSFATLLKSHNTNEWEESLKLFISDRTRLKEELTQNRNYQRIPVSLPCGIILELSQGEHNVLQKQIIEQFLPIFGMGAPVLYIGDTSDKSLYKNDDILKSLNFFTLDHEELPDIIAYSQDKNLLYLIEAVYSSGPMSEIRVRKLKRQLKHCKADAIFFTAFLTKRDFRKWAMDIAWETEVWIAETPEHLIHFNGYKFLELHK